MGGGRGRPGQACGVLWPDHAPRPAWSGTESTEGRRQSASILFCASPPNTAYPPQALFIYDHPLQDRKEKTSFFNWFYFFVNIGSFIAVTGTSCTLQQQAALCRVSVVSQSLPITFHLHLQRPPHPFQSLYGSRRT